MTSSSSVNPLRKVLHTVIVGFLVFLGSQHVGASPLSGAPSFSSPGASSSSHNAHSASSTSASQAATSSTPAGGLNPGIANCRLALPANALTPEGLSTPWQLLPPCSQSVTTQQAFAEAAVIDSEGQLSIYHPLIIDEGKVPPVAPVVPKLGDGSQVVLFFGFNGDVLTLVDTNGEDTNTSPILKTLQCVNGLPGVPGDVFGQVSWCNTRPFWEATNAAVANGKLKVPPLGTDQIGKQCPSTRSFEIVDQDQSDNLPTKYLLLPDRSTIQFTAANKAKFPTAMEIDNASDEALIADFIGPAIGCTPFEVPSIDDPGTKVASLATQELQAFVGQQEPIAIIPLNDPDVLLTTSQAESPAKTNAYRIGVNQPLLGTGSTTDEGSPFAYCDNLIKVQPPFLAAFRTKFSNTMTPDPGIGNNLFTFMANRFLQSMVNLACPNKNLPVKCTLDGTGAATACTIGNVTPSATSANATVSGTGVPAHIPKGHGFRNFTEPRRGHVAGKHRGGIFRHRHP